MALIPRVDLAAASRVTDVPHFLALLRNLRSPGASSRWQRPRCKVLMGSLDVRTMSGTGLEVVNIKDRRALEV